MIIISSVNEQGNSKVLPEYVPITDIPRKMEENIIPSKTLVINELNVTITQDFDEDVDFKIETKPGILSDNKTIPKLDINVPIIKVQPST